MVVLSDMEGFSYKEIAGILKLPVGTIRSRLARGRGLLQKILWDHALMAGLVKPGVQAISTGTRAPETEVSIQANVSEGKLMKKIKNIRCEEALKHLYAYLDQEIRPDKQEEMEKHFASCRSCFSKYEFEKQLKEHLIRVGGASVSSSFERRVKELIRQF